MSSRHQLPSIQVWIDTVTAETQRDIEQQNNQTQPASITRNRPLAPTSSNPRLGKRKQVEPATRQNPPRSCKRVKTMPTTRSNAGTNDENLTQNRRGSASRRGRPQGGGPVGRQVEGRGRGRGEISGPGQEPQRVGRIEITSRGRDTGLGRVQGRGQDIGGAQEFSVAAPSVVFAPPSQSSSQARARSTSPTKRGKTTIDKEKPDAKIQLVDLESCEPSVHLRSRARVIQGGELPPMVAKLDDLLHVKHGRFIPLQLKPFFDRAAATPRKTRRSLSADDYLPVTDTSFPEEFGPSIKGNVERVVEATEDNQTMQVHERQWGWTTISPLLNEVLVWPQNRGAVLVNVESCAVNPEEIRMLRPGRQRYVDETNSTTSTSANNSVTTTRMVDICLALNLEDTAREVVTRSWATWPDNLRSLNQTVSYIRIRPLFLDIEIKQLNQDREPLVQLGIWMAGLYQKRKLHGWDQSAPMPGLVVNGDRWDLYIGFARGDGVIMMASPTPFGSTATIAGTFEILYKLNILVQWGLKQYRRWFDEHILERFSRERAPGVYDD